ncbi:unnamed protein product, partial [Polarella glacialis]
LRGHRCFRVLGPADVPHDGIAGISYATVELCEDVVEEGDLQLAETLTLLVQEWRTLVEKSKFERFEGQIRQVLEDLGPMPPAEEAGDRALWVAALVNPLPGLGVAFEIRPQALLAPTVRERLQVVLDGIRGSIGHVSGTAPLF